MNTDIKEKPLTREIYTNHMVVEILHGEGEAKIIGRAGELAEDLVFEGTVLCPKGAWGYSGGFGVEYGILFGDTYEKLLNKLRYHYGEVRLTPITHEQASIIQKEIEHTNHLASQ